MNYILTHKNFTAPQWLSGDYTIITDGAELHNSYSYPIIKADNELAPLKHSYSELFQLYDIYMKDTTSDYIGINHYRRYFQNPTKENTIPNPITCDIYKQYAACHNIDHLLQVKEIINKYYPTYQTEGIGLLFPCNMSILEHDEFNKYCSFLFNVLQIFNENNHLYCDTDVTNYVSTYNNQSIEYQSRLAGFLSERISTIWFLNNLENNYKFKQIIMTNG